MAESLPLLETRRAELLQGLANLRDMRPVVGAVSRCGKPSCHCARAEDPGHGPNLPLNLHVYVAHPWEELDDYGSELK